MGGRIEPIGQWPLTGRVEELECAPEFTLAMGANSGRLTVDGKTFDITRPTPEGDWRLA